MVELNLNILIRDAMRMVVGGIGLWGHYQEVSELRGIFKLVLGHSLIFKGFSLMWMMRRIAIFGAHHIVRGNV